MDLYLIVCVNMIEAALNKIIKTDQTHIRNHMISLLSFLALFASFLTRKYSAMTFRS